ncbi:MAG TPA: HlyD family efflux transporter periplasmic adaptor subunit [Nitrospiraceae bacterium]|nr:HlyD family efflux transporter periplasmic adaptor subunit [Nitrospiraceae bacterium]
MKPTTLLKQEVVLPPLREDLRLIAGPSATDGSPTWVIVDPVRGKYFQIGWAAYQILSRWNSQSAEALLSQIRAETTCHATRQDIDDLLRFLYGNHLMREPPQGGYRAYVVQVEAARPQWLMWLVHHYLFFQIPLVRPDRFLRVTLPFVDWLFSKSIAWIIALIGLAGVYLVSRQWDTFTATVLHFFTPRGLALYALSLAVVKVFHELGHAYTATRYGCRVPTMGIAMVVMVPMLYSDTSDAWKLTSRHQRAAIGAAGMVVECALAALAIFAWNFLDDGVARSLVFIVATTSLMVGAGINLSPFMRFDGYYVLSDLLGIPNLHDRAFAFGRWQLRQLLLGLDMPMPEPVAAAQRRFLVWFAWGVWAYRLTLFLGIALMVYHYFFKLLGLVLFAIEIGWFIVLPIVRELKAWWTLRGAIPKQGRAWASVGFLVFLMAVLFIPWSERISLPAVLESTPHATIYAPVPGRIVELAAKEGRRVEVGDRLVVLESPVLEKDMALTRKRIEVEQLRGQREFVDRQELAKHQVTLETLKARLSQFEGLLQQQRNLALTAPIAGVVTDRAEALHVGQWINKELPLAYVIDPAGEELHALAPETDVGYLHAGQSARFIPQGPDRPSLEAQVVEIRDIDESSFTVPYLASLYGGDVPVREDANRRLKPETSVYRVTLHLVGSPPRWNQAVRGTVLVKGPRISFAQRAWEQGARIFIRESGA